MSSFDDQPCPWDRLLRTIDQAFPASKYCQLGVVVGCSGGADSVALLRAVVQLVAQRGVAATGFVIAAHFNHRLRNIDSDADQEFVTGLAEQLGVRSVVGRGDGERADEDHAREERYHFFGNLMRQAGARYLLLGHNLDDNVETVLFRLMRGTGPVGLGGIPPVREFSAHDEGKDFVIVRPMLNARRQQIRLALSARNYSWREDQSNQSLRYRRNWIRNQLMPQINEQFPNASLAIARAIDGQRQWNQSMSSLARQWSDLFQIRSNPLELCRLDRKRNDANELPSMLMDSAVCIEAIRQCWRQTGLPERGMTQQHWRKVWDLIRGEGPASICFPDAVLAIRDQNSVTFRVSNQAMDDHDQHTC